MVFVLAFGSIDPRKAQLGEWSIKIFILFYVFFSLETVFTNSAPDSYAGFHVTLFSKSKNYLCLYQT